MAPFREKAPPPGDFIKDTHLARGIGTQKQYDWLRPCETLLHVKEYEGPLRRNREPVLRPSRSYPSLQLPAVVSDLQKQSGGSAARIKPKQHRPKPYRTDIWPVGSQGPLWRPLSPGEQAHRHNANAAVAAAAPSGPSGKAAVSRSRSVPGRRPRRNLRDAAVVEPTPGIEAWDSVSQAPSSPRSQSVPSAAQYRSWEVLSAETATATGAREELYQDEDHQHIGRHLRRNRHGWYDHLNGRFLG